MKPNPMRFEPDIVVIEPDGFGTALVVEAKLVMRDPAGAEIQMKRHMAATKCPVGLIVTPQTLLLYRDRYLGPPEESVQRIGKFDITGQIALAPTHTSSLEALEFEKAVQSWIESLASESVLRKLPEDLRAAVEQEILPALAQGTVYAAHPRQPLNS